MYYRDIEKLRSMTCWQCIHMKDTKDANGNHSNKPTSCLCEVTKRWGKLTRGNYCERFEYRQWHNSTADDGIPIKNRQPLDYRTERQWLDCRRKLKAGAIGKEMYASRNNMKNTYTYYLIDETEEI